MNNEQFGELISDIKWIKLNLENKANKWVEKPLILVMTLMVTWIFSQIISLIPAVKALF